MKFNWTPNLVSFDANPSSTVLSVSWYAQSLLAGRRGLHTLPIKNFIGGINPLYWVATIDEPSDAIYVKVRLFHLPRMERLTLQVVNAGNFSIPRTLGFDTSCTVNGTILVSRVLAGSLRMIHLQK